MSSASPLENVQYEILSIKSLGHEESYAAGVTEVTIRNISRDLKDD